MKVFINGETRVVESATNVLSMVEELQLPAATLLIEHNGEALRRDEWATRSIADGDRFELVRVVAGG